jgi:competence ComEA-like helix-hairpin-helix protein
MGWTASERRGVVTIVLLLGLGTVWDLHRAAMLRRQPVPVRGVDSAWATGPGHDPARVSVPADSVPAPSRVDLNRASALELDALPGIGPVLAGRIVEHRRRHGPFKEVEDLVAVPGVGPALMERLRDRVRVRS